MNIYYDIVLKDDTRKRTVSYWADSFSVDENRILRVCSRDCGDVIVRIDVNERLSVHDVIVPDEFDN